MKRGFTMIELVFIIIILGILASVALPKFKGVSDQAHKVNLKNFETTLNASVAPTLWSKSLSDNKGGDISYLDLRYVKGATDNNFTDYTDFPKEIQELNTTDCNDSTTYKVVGYVDSNLVGKDMNISCKDGSAGRAPKFKLGNP